MFKRLSTTSSSLTVENLFFFFIKQKENNTLKLYTSSTMNFFLKFLIVM